MPQDYNTLTKEQKEAVAAAMAASGPQAEKVDSADREVALNRYKDEILDVLNKIDKSAYATVVDNQRTSESILDFVKRFGAVGGIDHESQLEHYEGIAVEHREQTWLRARIQAKIAEQGEAALTDDERNALTTKTRMETMLESATKTFFETQRANLFDTVKREQRNYERRLLTAPDKTSSEALKKSLKNHLDDFGKMSLWGRNGREDITLFTFSDRDVPKYVYDKAALDEYVKAYDSYVRANMVNVKREMDIQDLGKEMQRRAEELNTMGRDPSNQQLSYEDFSKLHDSFEQKYAMAKEKYENFLKETEADPAYKAHKSGPEYLKVVNMEYFERKYEGKRFDQIPDHEKPIYVAHKYENVGALSLRRIPAEERALFDKGIMIQALPRVLEMEANLDKVDKTMEKVWADTRNVAEQPFQKKELEENRAILSAYKAYILDGSKEKQQKFYQEVNKAYDNAKQNFISNPSMRARFELRSEQILKGDFTFVPMESRKNAKLYGMTANWDKHTYTREEIAKLRDIPKTAAEKQFDRAYSVHVAPTKRMALDFEIEQEIENRPEYTLKEMGQGLQGADLADYKATIHNEKMEQFNEYADGLNATIKNAKEKQKALAKHYGLISKFFNKNYKSQKALLDHDIKLCRKDYDLKLKQTKYDILKTYQEKGLALTKAEKKTLATITKEATRTGKILAWDEVRAEEKRRLDEMNAKWMEPEEPAYAEPPKEAKTIRLDLGDKIHAPKVKDQPVKEAPQMEKRKEIEQKVKENTDLEK